MEKRGEMIFRTRLAYHHRVSESAEEHYHNQLEETWWMKEHQENNIKLFFLFVWNNSQIEIGANINK